MADTCAQALDRISNMNEAVTQTAKLEFLADASAELASSLDYQATLRQGGATGGAQVCRLVRDRRGRGQPAQPCGGGARGPGEGRARPRVAGPLPPGPERTRRSVGVIRTGRSELIGEITDEMLVASAVDEEQLHIARDLNLRSAMTVPLVARGKVLGVLTWSRLSPSGSTARRPRVRRGPGQARGARHRQCRAPQPDAGGGRPAAAGSAARRHAFAGGLGGRELLQPVRAHRRRW